MPLQVGDCVRTEEGEAGTVVHINRMTVFVALSSQSEVESVVGFLESQLTKIEQPPDPSQLT